jgi:hypothetical protein
MTEEQIIRNIHENKDARPDSITIGTPSKGGELKIYFNATMPAEEIAKLIDAGFAARKYAEMLRSKETV